MKLTTTIEGGCPYLMSMTAT